VISPVDEARHAKAGTCRVNLRELCEQARGRAVIATPEMKTSGYDGSMQLVLRRQVR
jgi:hypothetical protein